MWALPAPHGKRLRLALVRPTGDEEQRLVLVVFLEQTGILESRDHGVLALDARERHGTDLLGVEVPPTLPIELAHEGGDEAGLKEVDEAVAYVAAVLEVDGQIEEVVSALVTHVHLLQQHLLVVLVRDIPHHDGGSHFLVCTDTMKVDHEVRVDLIASASLVVAPLVMPSLVACVPVQTERSSCYAPPSTGLPLLVHLRHWLRVTSVVVLGDPV